MSRSANRFQVLRATSPRRGNAPGPVRGHLLFSIVVAVLAAGVLLGKIYLERRTNEMGMAWEKEHRQLSNLLREHQNLNVERETHTHGNYILDKAREMGLAPPVPAQVRRMRVPEEAPADHPEDADLAAIDQP